VKDYVKGIKLLEVFFSIVMIAIPLFAVIYKRFVPIFMIAVIGANPYISAISLLLSLGACFKVFLTTKMNKSIVSLSIIWLVYGSVVGLINPTLTFFSEYIQLLISILFLIYTYHSIKVERDFNRIVWALITSGSLLSGFELFIVLFDFDINTASFIGRIPENYTSFYLVVTTIIAPLFFIKKYKALVIIILFGFLAIYVNESRAMMLLSTFFIMKHVISFRNIFIKIFSICIVASLILYVLMTFDDSLIYDSNSIFSVLNFENNFSNLERLKLLYYSFDLFQNNMLGYGLGSSYEIFTSNPVTVNDHYPHPHNTFAFLLVELGFVGAGIYLYFLFSMYQSSCRVMVGNVKSFVTNLFLALASFSIVDVLFYNGVLMLIVCFLYGVILSSSKVKF
jgi:hypothetical protein